MQSNLCLLCLSCGTLSILRIFRLIIRYIAKLSLLIFFTLFFFTGSAQTNNLVFHHLNKEKGFSQSVCNDLYKDSRGFIWITTQSGLFRFDGVNFLDVTAGQDKLKGHRLLGILEDKKGNLWLGKRDEELVKYDRNENSFQIINLEKQLVQLNLASLYIGIMYIDEYDRIWFLLNGEHLGVYDTNTGKLKMVYMLPHPSAKLHIYFEPVNIFNSVIYSKDRERNRMLRGSIDTGLTLKWIDHKAATFDLDRFSVQPDGENIWSVMEDKLVHYDWKTGKLETFLFDGETLGDPETLPSIVMDNHEQLWIQTARGVCSFDIKQKRFVYNFIHDPADPFSISTGALPVLCDSDNVLWVYSWGRGIDYCNLGSFKFTHVMTAEKAAKNGLGNFIRAMVCDDLGNVYASIENTGVVMLDSNGNYIKTVLKQGDVAFEYLLKDRHGNIWMGNKSLYCYDPVSATVSAREDKNISVRYASMLERKNGDLLLGTYYNVQLFNKTQKKIKILNGIRSGSAFGMLYELENNDLLTFQQDHGITLYSMDGDDYKLDKVIDPKLYVKSILKISPDTLWMATTTGIFAYIISQKKITTLGNLNDKLPNRYVYSILKGPNGYYWTSTNSGLFRWKPGTGEYKSFGKEFGVQDLEFNTHAYCKLLNGNLMFGGVNGINLVTTDIPDRFSIPAAKLQLISINADEKKNVSWLGNGMYEEFIIPPGNSTVEIEYNAIDFFNPQKIRVQYRLKNYNDEWVTGNNSGTARFVNIKPGSYQFEIMVSDADGNWTGQAQNLQIHFKPYWWQTAWFKAVLILCLALLIMYAIRLFVKSSLREQQRVLERAFTIQKERERIIADLHDDIGATLSSMNIYGDLAGNVWDTKPQESRKMIEKISTASKDLASRMGDIIWSMKPADEERYTLEPRLRNYCNELLAPKNIVCDFDIDEKLALSIINPAVRKNILLIIKEAVNNISKYSEASKATVMFRRQKELVILNISDNGKGYDSKRINDGNGLQNMLRRCKALDGTCVFNTAPGKGTEIICSFSIASISQTS